MTGPKPCAPACASGHPQSTGDTPILGNVPPFLYIQYFAISQNFFIITANNHRLQYPHPSHSPWALLEATPLLQSLCKIFLGKMSTFTTSKDTNLGVAERLPWAQRNANRLFLLLSLLQTGTRLLLHTYRPLLSCAAETPTPIHYPRDGVWKRTVLQLK